MERTDTDVTAFLSSLEGKQGEDMRSLDSMISEKMVGHERHLFEGRFWGGTDQRIVGYGVVDYVDRAGNKGEWFVVGLAAQKNNLSIYVNAVSGDSYLLREYEGKLGKVKLGSASIGFRKVEDLDLDSLMELIGRAADLTAP
jgi:hypothetical protein